MTSHQIVFLDTGATRCETQRCLSLAGWVRESFPELDVRAVSSSSEVHADSHPELVIVRLTDPDQAGHIGAVDSRLPGVPVLAVCCGFSPAKIGMTGSSCPVDKTDLAARIRSALGRTSCAVRRHPALDAMIGESPAFLAALSKLASISQSDATVVLSGETGTGKELFARAIHYMSRRKGNPFIPVNCGSVPDHLLENELFGHAKGAYTDASTAESGILTAAEGGTLFLDEVDALTAAAQVKLLRFLQDRQYRPLGSSRAIVANVRVVAATNSNLREKVAGRTFREDLFHRLNVLSLHVPPLRERPEDIPQLATHFLSQFAAQESRQFNGISSAAVRKLVAYDWPGNVRELESIIRRAVVLSESHEIEARDLELPMPSLPSDAGLTGLRAAKHRMIEQFERTYLINLLSAHGGNLSRAARDAGKERRSFQRLVRKHQIERRWFEAGS